MKPRRTMLTSTFLPENTDPKFHNVRWQVFCAAWQAGQSFPHFNHCWIQVLAFLCLSRHLPLHPHLKRTTEVFPACT